MKFSALLIPKIYKIASWFMDAIDISLKVLMLILIY